MARSTQVIEINGETYMIYDHRTYTCRPGTIRKHLALYGEHESISLDDITDLKH